MPLTADLPRRIEIAQNNIAEWYEYWEGKVYVGFSGGKDSTVLLHLVREMYPEVKGLFCNTGLEYPEIVKFVKTFDNIEIYRPKMPFHKVVETHGFPIISKAVSQKIWEIRHSKSNYSHNRKLSGSIGLSLPKKYRYLIGAPFKISDKCCHYLKKEPRDRFHKENPGLHSMIGIMAADSRSRSVSWKKHGCNAFKLKEPTSRPIMSWTTDHVWDYIRTKDIPYCSVYDQEGCHSTGCLFCGFGCHMDASPNRFERLKESHPKQYNYVINKLGMGKTLDFLGVPYGKSNGHKKRRIIKEN